MRNSSTYDGQSNIVRVFGSRAQEQLDMKSNLSRVHGSNGLTNVTLNECRQFSGLALESGSGVACKDSRDQFMEGRMARYEDCSRLVNGCKEAHGGGRDKGRQSWFVPSPDSCGPPPPWPCSAAWCRQVSWCLQCVRTDMLHISKFPNVQKVHWDEMRFKRTTKSPWSSFADKRLHLGPRQILAHASSGTNPVQ